MGRIAEGGPPCHDPPCHDDASFDLGGEIVGVQDRSSLERLTHMSDGDALAVRFDLHLDTAATTEFFPVPHARLTPQFGLRCRHSFAPTELGAGPPQVFAQDVQERSKRITREGPDVSIDRDADRGLQELSFLRATQCSSPTPSFLVTIRRLGVGCGSHLVQAQVALLRFPGLPSSMSCSLSVRLASFQPLGGARFR